MTWLLSWLVRHPTQIKTHVFSCEDRDSSPLAQSDNLIKQKEPQTIIYRLAQVDSMKAVILSAAKNLLFYLDEIDFAKNHSTATMPAQSEPTTRQGIAYLVAGSQLNVQFLARRSIRFA